MKFIAQENYYFFLITVWNFTYYFFFSTMKFHSLRIAGQVEKHSERSKVRLSITKDRAKMTRSP